MFLGEIIRYPEKLKCTLEKLDCSLKIGIFLEKLDCSLKIGMLHGECSLRKLEYSLETLEVLGKAGMHHGKLDHS